MPGRLFLLRPIDDIARALGADAGAVGDEAPRANISPGQDIVVCPPDRILKRMRWGIVPVGRVNARGRPVMETIVNVRSETVFEKSAFAGTGRAIVPADGWYEWTGTRGRKTAWRISARRGEPLFFAAVTDSWTAPGGRVLDQVATVTCPPSADVAPVHHRMGVLLKPDDLVTWLDGTVEAAASLMQPYPDGALRVEKADGVDWKTP